MLNRVGVKNQTRRQFLRSSLQTLVGVSLAGPLTSLWGCATPPPLTDRSIPRVLADLHVHAGINKWNRSTPLGIRYPGLAKLAETSFNRSKMNWADCHAAGIDLICSAHFNVFDEWLSMPTDPDMGSPNRTIAMIDQLEETLRTTAAPYARLARNPVEIASLLSVPKSRIDWRTAVVHTVEGGHALGGSLEPLADLARRNVAMIGITHFFNKGVATSANSYPFFPDNSSAWPAQGLSSFGHELITEMEKLGMIVDVTHATNTSMEDILKRSTRPLVGTHMSSRTLGDHPYGLMDDQAIEMARRGGLIGVILDPYLLSNYATLHDAEENGTLRDVVRTIRYLVKLVGHKHVGIGSDFAGYIAPPKDMKRLSRIGRLRNMLLDEFTDEKIVTDILADNVIEFLKTNWNPVG